MVFDRCKHPCNPLKYWTFPSPSEIPHMPPSQPSPSLNKLFCFLSPVPDFMCEFLKYVLSLLWLLFLSLMSLSSTHISHVLVWYVFHCFFIPLCEYIQFAYPLFSLWSSALFLGIAIANKAAVNIFVQVLLSK